MTTARFASARSRRAAWGGGGVGAARRLADLLGQAGLDVHVDVFQLAPEGEAPLFDLLLDLAQAPLDGVGGGDDALTPQHAGVGYGPGDVLAVKTLVYVYGGRVRLDRLVG